MDGFICVDKPTGPSSFAVVRAVGKRLGVKKAGHAGTLDPMASGLLVVALGRCTRLLEYLALEPKVYDFSVVFGRSTDTLDAEGSVTAESDAVPSEGQLAGALKNFAGEIEQVPPRYSAIKVGGARAYDLARKGVDVEMKPRAVTIFSLDLRGYDGAGKQADFTVSCSAGTYVRSLARDIVKAADAGAEGFVSVLRRTRTGRFDLSAAVSHQSLRDPDVGVDDVLKYVINVNDAFGVSEKVVITDRQKAEIAKGREIELCNNAPPGNVLIAFDASGSLSAVLKGRGDNRYHPEKVFLL